MLKKNKFIKLLLFIVLILIIVFFCIKIYPFYINLKDEQYRVLLINIIRNKGILGYLFFLLIQVLQVLFAFIPGEPVEIISGILYGTIGGYIICSLGILIGSIIAFYLVKKLGKKYVLKNVSIDNIKKYSFLNTNKKIDTILFILYLIPGTPKDILNYIVPLTDIKLSKFLIISLLARIPSIISSTYVGDSFGKGNILISLIVFILTGIIGLLGIIYQDKIIQKYKKILS